MPKAQFATVAFAIAFTAQSADAVIAFDATKILNSDYTDHAAHTPIVASDGAGSWAAFWTSPSATAFFSRSTDDGLTWSAAATMPGIAESVAVSSSGTCITAACDPDMIVVRSADHCATWSAATPVYSSFWHSYASIATDSAGNWVVMSQGYDQYTQTHEVFSSHSTDDGLTWSPRMTVSSTNNGSNGPVQLATDGNGTWMTVYISALGAVVSTSTDVGATWSAPVVIPVGPSDLIYDGAGTWMIAGGLFDLDIFNSVTIRSTDDGASWSSPTTIFRNEHSGTPRLRYHDGVWQAIWTQIAGGKLGNDGDIYGSRSLDGGLTWTDAAAINVNAANDGMTQTLVGVDSAPRFDCSPVGTCVLVWETILAPVPETDVSDAAYARSHDDCPSLPATGCHVSTNPGVSSIKLRNPVGPKDKLNWKWRSGELTTTSEIGNPTTTADYVVCMYDDVGGTMRNVFESDAAAAGTCNGSPCWKATELGYVYSDKDGGNGPVRSLSVETGDDGEARIEVRASGAALSPPVMPFALSPSVIAQVINTENGQ